MNRTVQFHLNGQPVTVAAGDAFETVAVWLRQKRCATGTKIVCEEGDCGACSVLVGRPSQGQLSYQVINSCIQFVYQMHGSHVITVEGLRDGDVLHPVQQAMAACHGAQCGYCTPGFITTMAGMLENEPAIDEATVRDCVTGNLCRCTGYEPIIRGGVMAAEDNAFRLNDLYPERELVAGLAQNEDSLLLEAAGRTFFRPATLEDALAFRAANPSCVIIQGATDLGVQHNKRGFAPPVVMTLSAIDELTNLSVGDDAMTVGASCTLTQLESACRDVLPEFHHILRLFGAPQIKNAATLAGNLANASPIADTIPFLFVMGAEVEAASNRGSRRIPIESFYLGYKKLALEPDEIITRIHIPLPSGGELLKLYKVSKRRNLDISTFTAAIRMRVEAGRIESARIAFGGVGPVILRLRQTEEQLTGALMSEETFRDAAPTARAEITPISDVRGSAAFRNQLAGNILLRFFHETAASDVEKAS